MNMNMHEFCWTELATTNVQKAKDFYSKTFGWQFHDMDMGDFTYTVIKNKADAFGGIWEIPTDQREQIPPHWMVYILVEDIKAAVTNARNNGANIIKDVKKVGDIGLMAIMTDPTGAHVALWQALQK